MNDRSYAVGTGPDPYDPVMRRKNVRTLLIVAALLVGAALIPAVYRRFQQPEALYPTYTDATDAKAVERGEVPRFIPATATDIHARRHKTTGRRFVRFSYDQASLPATLAGLRRVPDAEVERVKVPTPGWSHWWRITSRTLSGGQAKHLQVYEVPPGPDHGYVTVDPRTELIYYWSR